MTATWRQSPSTQQYLELPGYEAVALPLADQIASTSVVIPLFMSRYWSIVSFAEESASLQSPDFEYIYITRKRWQIFEAASGRAAWEWRWDTDEAEKKFILDGRVRRKYR